MVDTITVTGSYRDPNAYYLNETEYNEMFGRYADRTWEEIDDHMVALSKALVLARAAYNFKNGYHFEELEFFIAAAIARGEFVSIKDMGVVFGDQYQALKSAAKVLSYLMNNGNINGKFKGVEVGLLIVSVPGGYAYTGGTTVGGRDHGAINLALSRGYTVWGSLHSHPEEAGSLTVISEEDAGLRRISRNNFFVTPSCSIFRVPSSGFSPQFEGRC